MTKPEKPLLAEGARGSIGGILTFQTHKTGQQAHIKKVPKDRRSTAQIQRRSRMASAAQNWALESEQSKQTWNQQAKQRGIISGYNLYVKAFLESTAAWYRFGQAKFGQAKFGGPKIEA